MNNKIAALLLLGISLSLCGMDQDDQQRLPAQQSIWQKFKQGWQREPMGSKLIVASVAGISLVAWFLSGDVAAAANTPVSLVQVSLVQDPNVKWIRDVPCATISPWFTSLECHLGQLEADDDTGTNISDVCMVDGVGFFRNVSPGDCVSSIDHDEAQVCILDALEHQDEYTILPINDEFPYPSAQQLMSRFACAENIDELRAIIIPPKGKGHHE